MGVLQKASSKLYYIFLHFAYNCWFPKGSVTAMWHLIFKKWFRPKRGRLQLSLILAFCPSITTWILLYPSNISLFYHPEEKGLPLISWQLILFYFKANFALLITCFLLCWSFAPCGSQMSIRIVDIYLIILFILLLRSLFILLLVSLAPTPHISVFEICVSLSLSPLPSLSPSLPPSFPLSHTHILSLFLCISLFNQCNLITPGQVKLNHFCFQAESIVLWMNAVLGSLEFFFFQLTHMWCVVNFGLPGPYYVKRVRAF